MSQETNTEDLTILAAIDELERGADPSVVERPRGDETAETLARLYTEVLGLIPSELDPVAPGAGARDRLLGAIGAAPAVLVPEPSPVPAIVPAPAPAAASAITEAASRPAPRMAPGPLPRRHSRWPLALAATLALAFAGAAAWLWLLQQGQRTEIAQLRQELEAQRQLSAQVSQDRQQARTEMEKMRARFALVTSPSVEVRPLRPVGGGQTQARGMLFVAADHQHWYLSVEGLQPPPEGGVYKLWWVTKDAVLDAGSVVAQSGEKVQMSSDEMPAGIVDVVLTLESNPSSNRPDGTEILRTSV